MTIVGLNEFVNTNQQWFRNDQVIVVDAFGGGDFEKIKDALNLALGDPSNSYTIMVAPSPNIYNEFDLPMPSNTTIWGAGPYGVRIGAGGAGAPTSSTFKATADVSNFKIYNCSLLQSLGQDSLFSRNGFNFGSTADHDSAVLVSGCYVDAGTVATNSGKVIFVSCSLRSIWAEAEAVGCYATNPNQSLTATVWNGGKTGFGTLFASTKMSNGTVSSSTKIVESHFDGELTGVTPVTANDNTHDSKFILSSADDIAIPENFSPGSPPLSLYMTYSETIEAPAAATTNPDIAFSYTENLTNPSKAVYPYNRVPFRWRTPASNIEALSIRAVVNMTVPLTSWRDNSSIIIAKITGDGQLVSSGIAQTRVNKSTTYTVMQTDYYIRVDTSSGNKTVFLPDYTTVEPGKMYVIKNVGANIVIVNGFAADAIDGNLTHNISTQNDAITIIENGVDGWDII